MVHKPIAIMILPVFVAAVLLMGILATISSHSQVFADKSSKGYNNAAEESSNSGNAAQESSNNVNTEEQPGLCFNEHTKTWQTCPVETSPQKHESSKTQSSQESSNNGKVAQESSNKSSASVRPATTITPQFTVTPKAHMTTTNQELSKKGILPKLTLAKPTALSKLGCGTIKAWSSPDCQAAIRQAATAPRLIGAKSIADVQKLKAEGWVQFDPKKEICQGIPVVGRSPFGDICSGKVISKNEPRKIEQQAMHPFVTAFVPKCEKLEPTCEKSMHGSALIHEGPGKIAKMVQKVGGETLNMSKALLGIKGK
jgi:hypothetical protein